MQQRKLALRFEFGITPLGAIAPNGTVLPTMVGGKTINTVVGWIAAGRLPVEAVEFDGPTVIFHLDKLPVINRTMVQSASATELITLEYRLLKHQAQRKVYKHYLDALFPMAKQDNFIYLYGEADTARLAAAGVTESGFRPKTQPGAAQDVYLAKELVVALRGYSKLPKVVDALEEGGKMTPAKALMTEAIQWCKACGQPTQAQLLAQIERADEQVQALMAQIARCKAAIIIGQSWFVEAGDQGIEVDTFSATVDGVTVEAKITQREVEVEI